MCLDAWTGPDCSARKHPNNPLVPGAELLPLLVAVAAAACVLGTGLVSLAGFLRLTKQQQQQQRRSPEDSQGASDAFSPGSPRFEDDMEAQLLGEASPRTRYGSFGHKPLLLSSPHAKGREKGMLQSKSAENLLKVVGGKKGFFSC